MNKRYIVIFEGGDGVHFHEGDLPPEILPAADDGLYDVIDITEPGAPLRYWDEGWTNLEGLPTC